MMFAAYGAYSKAQNHILTFATNAKARRRAFTKPHIVQVRCGCLHELRPTSSSCFKPGFMLDNGLCSLQFFVVFFFLYNLVLYCLALVVLLSLLSHKITHTVVMAAPSAPKH